MSSWNDLSLRRILKFWIVLKEKSVNTPVREFEKFLSVSKINKARLKCDKLELHEAFSGAQSGEAG